MPVGPYFKGGMTPVNLMICEEYDRAAPLGTGSYKVGGNYAASLEPNRKAQAAGFADMLYLDAQTHTCIDEVGAANFFGITADNRFVTPKSPSVLPSITKASLIHIAENMLGMEVQEREIPVDSLGEFTEAGACGTAAVISPIGGISYQGKMQTFNGDGNRSRPRHQKGSTAYLPACRWVISKPRKAGSTRSANPGSALTNIAATPIRWTAGSTVPESLAISRAKV